MRTPRDYGSLRDEQSRANEALNQHVEQSEQTVSAQLRPSADRGVSAGMDAQNDYANRRFAHNNAQLEERRGQQQPNAQSELNQHVEGQDKGLQDAAQEKMDRHIENPEPQKQADIQQQPNLDLDI